jgi:hypothetical protein
LTTHQGERVSGGDQGKIKRDASAIDVQVVMKEKSKARRFGNFAPARRPMASGSASREYLVPPLASVLG